MEGKSRVLIIGATGRIGRHLCTASISSGHPTYALTRETAPPSAAKAELLQHFVSSGVKLLQIMDQTHIIRAIKETGCIRRFFPSEFGVDAEKIHLPDKAYTFHTRKVEIRRILREESIPFTIISCNYFATFLLPSLVQPGFRIPPRNKAFIYGDGNTKAIFVKEEDVANFTINTVDDSRTLNKIVYFRPPGNIHSMNELINLWETKIGKPLEKIQLSEEEILKTIQDNPYPRNFEWVFIYSAFIKGDHIFEIGPWGVEVTELYPGMKYTTISEYLDTLL